MREKVKLYHAEEWYGHTHTADLVFDVMMPLEIVIDFTPGEQERTPGSIRWKLSRDMMIDAVLRRKPGGIGDVKMRAQVTEQVGTVLILAMTGWDDSMARQENTMELAISLPVVENFLRKTLAIRPQHSEDLVIGRQIDAGLAKLLAS